MIFAEPWPWGYWGQGQEEVATTGPTEASSSPSWCVAGKVCPLQPAVEAALAPSTPAVLELILPIMHGYPCWLLMNTKGCQNRAALALPHHARVPGVQMDPKYVGETSAAHPTTPHGRHNSQGIRERAAEAPLKCPWMPPRGQVENFWAEKKRKRDPRDERLQLVF